VASAVVNGAPVLWFSHSQPFFTSQSDRW